MNSQKQVLTFPRMLHVIVVIAVLVCFCHSTEPVHESLPERTGAEEEEIPFRPITILPGDCLHELFSKYSTDDGRMDQDGFTKLLQNLGLGETKQTEDEDGKDDHANDHDDHAAEALQMIEKDGDDANTDEHEADTHQSMTSNSKREKRAPDVTTKPQDKEGKSVTTPVISTPATSRTSGAGATSAISTISQPVPNGTFGHGAHTDHHRNDYHVTECLSAEAVLDIFDDETSASGLTQDQFFQVCPVLLQQLDSHVCVKFNVNGEPFDQSLCEPAYNDMDEPTDPSFSGIPQHIWGYAFAAVTLISMASIVCILVVPCMQRFPKIYARLLSFLVAMAVGTLSGDAVMHLMPHAFGFHGHKEEDLIVRSTPIPGCEDVTTPGSHGHDSEHDESTGIDWANNVVIKGLVVLMGIFSFFVIEQLMQLCRSCRQKRHKPGDNGSNYTQLKPKENVGAKLCNHSNVTDRLSIMADPTTAAQIDALLSNEKQEPTKASVLYKCNDERRDSQTSDASQHSHHSSHNAVTICVHSDAQIHISPNPTYHHGDGDHKHKHNDHQQGGEEDGYHEDHHHHRRRNSHDKEVDLHDEGGHHGHSHTVPPPNAGIATLAWIVVMGDGLHNFCDGLVVGAAFADSLAGGLSTAIAVMCHELPHELGDFAVMLKAGMSVKQALAFQGMSSILAYIGMAMGVAMGNISMLSLWIFALASGMFLYIALADLFPEMVDTTSTTKDSKCIHLLLQILGVMVGIGLMLAIGLLEEDLMAALTSRREGS